MDFATVVARLAHRVGDFPDRLASPTVAVVTILPPLSYLPYMVLATPPESAEVFASAVGLLVVGFFLFILLLLPAAQAVTGVLKTALYIYARDGGIPEEFAGEGFQALFEGRRGGPSRGRI